MSRLLLHGICVSVVAAVHTELRQKLNASVRAGALNILLDGTVKCLDLPGGNAQNGQLLQIWDCNQQQNQDWIFDPNAWKIQYAGASWKCIDNIGDGAAGNKLGIWDCNGQDSQKWGYDYDAKTLYLASSSSDASLCMDLLGGDTTNGNKIDVWSCNGHSNQKWDIGYGYDPSEAKMFAALSSVTYCDDTSKVYDWSCATCQESNTPLLPGKIQLVDLGDFKALRVLVGKLRDQNGCVLAFRGSHNVWNWLRDFQAWSTSPKSYPNCDGCEVHSGFYETWQNLRDKVIGALQQVGCAASSSNADNLLYVTGHSLGAAITHLAMFSLSNRGFNIAKTYSFEAPRVGNKAFSDAFSQRFERNFPVFRITHAEDPVVHVPANKLGYQHVQKEVYYSADGSYTVCPNVEDKNCADQYWDVPGMVALHAGDHCGASLVSTGDICTPNCGSSSTATAASSTVAV